MAFEFDNEAVIAKTSPSWTRLDSGQVQRPRRKGTENLIETSGSIARLKTDDRRSVVTRRGRHAIGSDEQESRLVPLMIFDRVGEHVEAVDLGRQRWRNRSGVCSTEFGVAKEAGTVSGRIRRLDRRGPEVAREVAPNLGRSKGKGQNSLDGIERLSGAGEQVHVDFENHFSSDVQVDIKDQLVKGEIYGPFDGILERYERRVDLSAGHREDCIRNRRSRHEFGLGEIGLTKKRLFREGSARSKVGDSAELPSSGIHAGRIVSLMDVAELTKLIEDLQTGAISPEDAFTALSSWPFADLGFARVDHHRGARQGMPEAIYAPGKSPAQCAAIVAELLENGDGPVLLTRANTEQVTAALSRSPGGDSYPRADALANQFIVSWRHAPTRVERIVVVTAGTADLPVASECAATLRAFGFAPLELFDCGVAGVHRLLANYDDLAAADAIVVLAGMEGALASVVGGLVASPVVAVPTSVGYGAALEGVTALLAMHASCAPGVTVVGIDNGYGAACAVARIFR